MIPSPVTVQQCTTPVGPRVPTSRDPLEMFSHFFDHGLLSDIVRETNRYPVQCLAAANSHAMWTTTVEELKAYLGFMIVMGINRLPEIRDYWSTDEKMHNTFIASRITRDRFEQISRYLHLVNNTSLPSRNQPSAEGSPHHHTHEAEVQGELQPSPPKQCRRGDDRLQG